MIKKYSDDVQNILNVWVEEVQKLTKAGKVSPTLAENISVLIENGDIDDVKKIRSAIEYGVKNVGSN